MKIKKILFVCTEQVKHTEYHIGILNEPQEFNINTLYGYDLFSSLILTTHSIDTALDCLISVRSDFNKAKIIWESYFVIWNNQKDHFELKEAIYSYRSKNKYQILQALKKENPKLKELIKHLELKLE